MYSFPIFVDNLTSVALVVTYSYGRWMNYDYLLYGKWGQERSHILVSKTIVT